MVDALYRTVRRLRQAPDPTPEAPRGRSGAAAFRAAIEMRLGALERDVAELKSRINGLIFVVAGAVITQVVLKLVQE